MGKELTLLQMSDLHLEFSKVDATDWPDADILALCGDIGIGLHHRPFVESLCASGKYKYVILVTGNHEYYNQVVEEVDHRWSEVADSIDNLYFLNGKDYLELDNHLIAACTLWSDLSDIVSSNMAQYYMNDYRMIRSVRAFHNQYNADELMKLTQDFDINVTSTWHQGSPATKTYYVNSSFAKPVVLEPRHTTAFHKMDVAYLEKAVEFSKTLGKKLVVFTHHTPNDICLSPKHSGGSLDDAYRTDLARIMLDTYVWACGHTHNRMDITVNNCRLIMNCRGYVSNHTQELAEFVPILRTI